MALKVIDGVTYIRPDVAVHTSEEMLVRIKSLLSMIRDQDESRGSYDNVRTTCDIIEEMLPDQDQFVLEEITQDIN